MIRRIFHPIGQGGFASEKHKDFNIIYDCGSLLDSKKSQLVVKQAFSRKTVIDVLFISHFDGDHINKITVLKKHCVKINTVILPLLEDDEKSILANYFRSTDQADLIPLVQNPRGFFGDDTRIIEIEPIEPEDPLVGEINEKFDLSNFKSRELQLKSGTQFSVITDDWVFIPYNFKLSERRSQFEAAFNKLGLDLNEFMNDIDYGLKNKSKVSEAYKKVKGGINQNSMLLYSGPAQHSSDYYMQKAYSNTMKNCIWCISTYVNRRPGCIYTGDTDFNKIPFQKAYQSYWIIVGTIQIPHHGDIKAFDSNYLKRNYFYSPVHFDTNNKFAHPSSRVISTLVSRNSTPILITEKTDSMYIQIIKKTII